MSIPGDHPAILRPWRSDRPGSERPWSARGDPGTPESHLTPSPGYVGGPITLATGCRDAAWREGPSRTRGRSTMSDDELRSIIGKPMSKSKVVVERGPVANFATAVADSNPVYRDRRAAAAVGLKAIPVPPTFPFVMQTW